MRHDYIFGANILENLTTGMYKDSKVIFREYIQNSCDSIDKAISIGILEKGEEIIEITIENNNRNISIEDNGTAINQFDFERILKNIADSDKKIGQDKGFRGIGRLAGLAYCETLIFTSKAKGEIQISKMICDAKTMRDMIEKHNNGQKYKVEEVLDKIFKFDYSEKTDDLEKHYFKVDLININDDNRDLLDCEKIKTYLSFVAPIVYKNTFTLKNKIYKYSQEIGTKIDEYNISLNGETLFKNYTNYITKNGNEIDRIFDIEFREFRDRNENLICWMWFGLRSFVGALEKDNVMRGLRLRKENLQIGDENVLQKLFKEDRGNNYFIGEVFAVSKQLIPNSQRDYFNENTERIIFEEKLQDFFEEKLQKIYRIASDINSANKEIKILEKLENEYNTMEKEKRFIDSEHKRKKERDIEEAQVKAKNAKERIKKIIEKSDITTKKVIEEINKIKEEKNTTSIVPKKIKNKLENYNVKTRNLIIEIFKIIDNKTSENTAKIIKEEIEKLL